MESISGFSSSHLTQEEIDTLLHMLSEDNELRQQRLQTLEAQEGVVRRYDFHQPGRLSKEHLRTLRMIHENMARRLALQLSTKLRASIEVNLAFIESGPYADFIQQISEAPGALHLISMKPLPGRVLIQYENRLADMLVDRVLGGAGLPSTQADRELTDLEMELLSSVTEDILDALEDSWRSTIEISCQIEDKLTNPYFVQIALPTDTCTWVSFEMAVNGHGAALNFCIPVSVLKPIAPKLSPQAWISGAGQQIDEAQLERIRRHMRRHLDTLQLELTAILEGGELQLAELLSLEVGDVVPLQRYVGDKALVAIQGHPKFAGFLGTHRGKIAVEITDVFDENETPRPDTL